MAKKSIQEIIAILQKDNLLTNSVSTKKVIDRFKSGKGKIRFIVTSGMPRGTAECSRCDKKLRTSQFSYYQARVTNEGYLSRSNAVCKACSQKNLKKRKKIFLQDKEHIPKKPKGGSICPRCERSWGGTWHRDHDEKTGKFNCWLCNNCNMAKGDQRNPHITDGG